MLPKFERSWRLCVGGCPLKANHFVREERKKRKEIQIKIPFFAPLAPFADNKLFR
jgi:nitrate reductase beta subunit